MMKVSVDVTVADEDHRSGILSLNKTELWPCIVEQGLIALLETICAGSSCFVFLDELCEVDVTKCGSFVARAESEYREDSVKFSNMVKFPEEHIRRIALSLLDKVISTLIEYDHVKARLFSAMLHSGNTKLRINVLTGFIFMSGRSAPLGK
jgi:hypothetical protein